MSEEEQDYKEKYIRAVADLENYKKRQEKEMEKHRKTTTRSILSSFLPVIDDLNTAISESSGALSEGLKLTRDKLLGELEKHGVKPLKSLGKDFDPNLHDALMVIKKEGHEEGTVISVVEEGYTMGDFLLKPAKVVVSE